MKVLVYGAGVLGCNLANNLFRAGKDVTLLARGKWAESIKKDGLRIKKMFSSRTSVSRVPVVTGLAPEDGYDVIVVPCRICDTGGIRLLQNGRRPEKAPGKHGIPEPDDRCQY